MMTVWQLLGLNFAILMGVILLLWLVSLKLRDVSFIDAFWPFGMVILAWTSWAQGDHPFPRAALILMLVTIWGLRLSWHLFTRWRAHGEDPRYRRIMAASMEDKGWSWGKTALLKVFLLQGPLLFITCLPAQLGIYTSFIAEPPLGLLAIIGAMAALVGIAFESIGDAQLKRFRTDPANAGKVLDTGLWRYTRHPNYFGDACFWWGIFLIALDSMAWMLILPAIIGPLFLNFTLVKWSGAALLEKGLHKTRPGYADYVKRTSPFLPRPPKKA